jgi:hypothetical protein
MTHKQWIICFLFCLFSATWLWTEKAERELKKLFEIATRYIIPSGQVLKREKSRKEKPEFGELPSLDSIPLCGAKLISIQSHKILDIHYC